MSRKRICVFCGASPGDDPAFRAAALDLGRAIAARDLGLVTGGGSTGLMGAVAEGCLAAGGEVVGVIPRALARREIAHTGLTDLRMVGTMHERKAEMAALSDAFVALPGGIGTLEELFEVWTWVQLGAISKPCGLLNVRRFFDPLLAFLDGVVARGFLRPADRAIVAVSEDPSDLLAALACRPKPAGRIWIEPGER